jgi:hypothetical protein
LRGIVSPAATGSTAQLAPVARRDWSAQRVFTQVAAAIGQRIGSSPRTLVNEQPLSAP